MEPGDHVDDEDLEILALGRMGETRAKEIREHTLECSLCAIRAADALAFAAKLKELQAQQNPKRDNDKSDG